MSESSVADTSAADQADSISSGTPSEKPAIKDAGAPFDRLPADIILRSSDGTDFHVFKNILSFASPVFNDMFSVPTPTTGSDQMQGEETRNGLPVVRLSEDAGVLNFILRSWYPLAPPDPPSFEIIHPLMEACRKYDIHMFDEHIHEVLLDAIPSKPLEVFLLAIKYEMETMAAKAAMGSLNLEFPELLGSFLITSLTVRQYRELLSYHYDSARRAETALLSSIGHDWIVGNSWPNLLANVKFAPCTICSGQADDGVIEFLRGGTGALSRRYNATAVLPTSVVQFWAKIREAISRRPSVDAVLEVTFGVDKQSVCSACLRENRPEITKQAAHVFRKRVAEEIHTEISEQETPNFCEP